MTVPTYLHKLRFYTSAHPLSLSRSFSKPKNWTLSGNQMWSSSRLKLTKNWMHTLNWMSTWLIFFKSNQKLKFKLLCLSVNLFLKETLVLVSITHQQQQKRDENYVPWLKWMVDDMHRLFYQYFFTENLKSEIWSGDEIKIETGTSF